MNRSFRIGVLLAVWAGAAAVVARASTIDQLIEKLKSGDEQAQLEARQLLPCEGVEAAPRLLPLLGNENEVVWRTAFNVLSDIANEVSAPGRETERAKVTAELMVLLAPKQPASVKERALRLLPIVAPEGADLGPMATLLRDHELREKARAALETIGTSQARTALRNALKGAEPDFACALLNSLGRLEDEKSVPHILKLTRHDDPAVRVAAARALAWTGDPRYRGTFQKVRETADEKTAFDATDALLRYADAMARKGGNWNRSIKLYREALETTESPALKGAAVMGLSRYGDETVVDDIVKALRDAEPRLQCLLVSAFDNIEGPGAAKRMAAAYPELPQNLRVPLLRVFGRKRDPVLLPIIVEAAQNADPVFRQAGLRALGPAQRVEGLPILAEAARAGSEEEKTIALVSAKQIADGLRAAGDTQQAGIAYLALCAMAQKDDERHEALRGLAACPVPEAYDTLAALVLNAAFREEAVAALIAVAEQLAASGQSKRALDAYETVRNADSSPEVITRIAPRINELGGALNAAQVLGVVTSWRLAGPFTWKDDNDWATRFVNEPDIDFGAAYRSLGREFGWKNYTTQYDRGVVDLIGIYGANDRCFAYAYAEIVLDRDVDAVIRLGTDDGNKVWVNGDVVAENRVDRGMAPDQDAVNATFHAGTNRILVKISQGGGGWCFCLRLTDAQGNGLTFKGN